MPLDASSRKFRDKWSAGVEAYGYTMVPNLLLDNAFDLKLTTRQLMILVVLERYRWERNGDVFPSYPTIGAQSGMSGRTVERQIKELVKGKYITVEREPGRTNHFNLEPIVQLLTSFAKGRKRQYATRNPRRLVMGRGDRMSYDKDPGTRPP